MIDEARRVKVVELLQHAPAPLSGMVEFADCGVRAARTNESISHEIYRC